MGNGYGRREARPGRRAGRWSIGMLAFVPVSYVVGFALGTALMQALGLEEGAMLREAGATGIIAGVGLTLVLMAPQLVGAWLGERALRAGERRLGIIGIAANGILAAYFALTLAAGLLLG